jgi:GGDEF domain-containing protein
MRIAPPARPTLPAEGLSPARFPPLTARVTFTLPPALRPVLAPAAILLAAALAVAAGPRLPPSLAGLTEIGPYVVLLLGAAIGVWFNRSRAFIALASLFVAYAGYRFALELGASEFAAHAVLTAIAILVPLNILVALMFPERGISQHRNYRWVMFGAAEILIVAWIASAGRSSLSGTVWRDVLDHWLLRSPPTPFLGRLILVAAFAAAVARAWQGRSPLDFGTAGALVALFIACEWTRSPAVFGAFMSAAGLVLLVSVLQESHRLAFRDELTGLPSRRALDERLSGLGPLYSVAMVDVDHFKVFNDAHGHHIGDQVLKLVAARLAEIGGGGTAFRYGGEEFCVLFPERTVTQILPHLEELRRGIETYRMAVRGTDRPKDPETGSQLRAAGNGKGETDQALSVTVSIGAAERDYILTKPSSVIRAADEALYRAKRGGRNRISR